jgi:stage II sporulation protein D
MMLRLVTAAGSVEMRGGEFRAAVGVGAIRSTLFTARVLPGQTGIELTGRGSGHGVGLSQWGARGLAAAGRDHGEILRYYYTGVVVGARP